MLHKADERWVLEAYPGLVQTDGGVAGSIEFEASYDVSRDLFQILEAHSPVKGDGSALTCRFEIRIEERRVKSFSELPALYVGGVDPTPDRHFGGDKSACLCSSLEEGEFLAPDLQFRSYLERLIIPFLYGQTFYSLNGRWPWSEYAHYATGLLESYARYPDRAKTESLLQSLTQYRDIWPAIRAALLQRNYVKGHTPCFCEKKDQIRRCHPDALRGLQRLWRDVRELNLPIA
jgi:hypothetical protein